nr:MAG: RNA-dependent RNA polymerase [brine shrimp dicistrovirus 1]
MSLERNNRSAVALQTLPLLLVPEDTNNLSFIEFAKFYSNYKQCMIDRKDDDKLDRFDINDFYKYYYKGQMAVRLPAELISILTEDFECVVLKKIFRSMIIPESRGIRINVKTPFKTCLGNLKENLKPQYAKYDGRMKSDNGSMQYWNEYLEKRGMPKIVVNDVSDVFSAMHLNCVTENGMNNFDLLKLSGDVESNPGPVQSRPVNTRNNDPRVLQLENAMKRKNEKISTLKKKIKRQEKEMRIWAQCDNAVSTKGIHRIIADMRRAISNGSIHKIQAQGILPSLGAKDTGMDVLNQNMSRVCDFLENSVPAIQANVQTVLLQVTDKLSSMKDDFIKLVLLLVLLRLLFGAGCKKMAVLTLIGFIVHFYGFDKSIIELVSQLKREYVESVAVQQRTVPLPIFAVQNAFKTVKSTIHNRFGERFASESVEETTERIEAQNVKEVLEETVYHPWFDTIGKLIFAMLAFFCIKKIPGKQDWDNYITRLDRIPKAISGCKQIIDYCGTYFTAATDQLKMMILGKTKEELKKADGLYLEIIEWADTVRNYLKLTERDKIDSDPLIANKVLSLYDQGLKYKSELGLSREMQALITATLQPAKGLYEYVTRSPVHGGGPRMPPLCIWLVGESQIGKSQMIYPLCIDLLDAMGMLKPDFANMVYLRDPKIQYYDGYVAQPIVYFDDAFQIKDQKGAPNEEIIEIIRLSNNMPQHLHMAAIADKNTYSRAQIAIFTTNQYRVSAESITHVDALYNRLCEYMWRVEIREEYGKEAWNEKGERYITIDTDKLGEDPIDLNIYAFYRMYRDPSAEGGFCDTGEVWTYGELSDYLRDEYRKKVASFTAKNNFLNARVDKLLNPQPRAQAASEYGDAVENVEDTLDDLVGKSSQTLDEIEYELLGKDEELYFAFVERRKSMNTEENKWTKAAALFDKYRKIAGDKMLELGNEIKKVISEYPFFTMLSMLGLVLTGLAMYTLFTSESDDEEKVVTEVGSSGDFKTVKTPKVKVEVGSSGDYKTIKVPKVKVEVGSSGDHKTVKVPKIKVEAGSSGDFKTIKTPKIKVESFREQEKRIIEEVAISQGVSDKNAHKLVLDNFRDNTYRISFKRDDKRVYLGNATFVTGWSFVMPKHFLNTMFVKGLASDSIIYFSQDGLEDVIKVPVSHLFTRGEDDFELSDNVAQMYFKSGEERDCVMVNLHGKMCTPHKTLLPHFVRIADQGKLNACSGMLATFHVSNKGTSKEALVRSYNWLNNIRPTNRVIEIYYPSDVSEDDSYFQRDCYEYNAPTVGGDCGSLVAVFNNYLERKIIGMHIAGSEKDEHGFAVPITQEALQDAIDSLKSKNEMHITAHFAFENPSMCLSETEAELPEGKFISLGKSNLKVGQAVKTSLQKSRIYGLLSKPITAPAILKPTIINGERVDPLMRGLKKCGVDTDVFSDDEVNSASFDVQQRVLTQYNMNLDKSKYQRILSYEEAIKGTGDDKFMCAVNRTTSPGFPYCTYPKSAPGKQQWMGSNNDFDFTSESALQLRKDVEQLENNCANGIIKDVVFVDTLKDERRPFAKVEAGKTRVFSAGPQHFVVAFRRRFLPFSAWLMHNRIDNEMAVGTNPYSLDWTRIAKRLKLKGDRVIAGDFGNFDGSLNAQLLWAIFWNVFVPWLKQCVGYSDRELNICVGLWAHLVHSVHIYNDNLYMWTHSQPSGNPFTVIINCLYNMVIMRLSWIRVMKKVCPRLVSMKSFRQYVSMMCYGDDNVLNIHADVTQYFNQVSISEVMTEMMHEYTDETKTGKLVEYRTLGDVDFLKRKFVWNSELMQYVAPLNKDVIYEMMNWTRNGLASDEILMTNIENAFREIVLHGREEYKILRKAVESLHVPRQLPRMVQILTYEQYVFDIENCGDEFYSM